MDTFPEPVEIKRIEIYIYQINIYDILELSRRTTLTAAFRLRSQIPPEVTFLNPIYIFCLWDISTKIILIIY